MIRENPEQERFHADLRKTCSAVWHNHLHRDQSVGGPAQCCQSGTGTALILTVRKRLSTPQLTPLTATAPISTRPVQVLPILREGVARHAGIFYGLDVDPEAGVIVTAGATQGVYSAIMGLVDPGDEVIIIEPYYDSYVPGLYRWRAGNRFTSRCTRPNWTFDEDELRAAFSDNTRAVILNTPK